MLLTILFIDPVMYLWDYPPNLKINVTLTIILNTFVMNLRPMLLLFIINLRLILLLVTNIQLILFFCCDITAIILL